MEFRILGPLEVTDGERSLALGAGRQKALVALLLLRAGEAVPSETIVDELWDGSPPPTANKAVQNHVSQLRRILGAGRLETRGSAYALAVAPGELDVGRFEELLAEGRGALAAGDARQAADLLRGALALWRGPALADLRYESFAQAEIARLDERRLVALEERIEADLGLGRHSDLVGELEALVAEHPLRERLRGQLMLALYRSGRQAEALDVYRQTRRALVDELGIEPGAALQRLHAAMLRQDPALEAPAAEMPRAGAAPARLRPAVLAALGAGLVLVAVAVGLYARGSDSAELSGVAADSVGLIDPRTNRIVAQVPVGATPAAIAAGGDAVWALNADSQTVSRIDPDSKDVTTFSSGGTPTGLAAGERALWVGDGRRLAESEFGRTVVTAVKRVDPTTRVVRESVRLRRNSAIVSNLQQDMAAHGGDVWVTGPDYSVVRIDGDTDRITATVDEVEAYALAAARDAVWVLNTLPTLARIDAETGEVTKRIKVAASGLTDIAVGDDGVIWLADPYDGVVWRVAHRPRLVMRTIDVGEGATHLAVGAGAVWVTNGVRGTVTRIDPKSNEVAAVIDVGNTPRDVVVTDEGVWITVAGGPGVAVSDRAREGALPEAICGPVLAGSDEPDLLIASDLPLQGGGLFTTVQMSEAIAYVLRRRGFRAGEHRVGYQSCDDSTAQRGIFDADKCASNAKAYVRTERVVGVVGPFNSECAFEILPIANPASLAVVSPTVSAAGITRPSPLAPPDFLERLYPSGRRNFARVASGEEHQAAANAVLARTLGVRRVAVLHDGEVLFGTHKAVLFRRSARRVGLEVVTFARWNPRAQGYAGLAERIAAQRPDAVFLGGGIYSNGGAVIRSLRERLGSVPILAPEFLPTSDLFDAAGPAAEGTYVSVLGLTLEGLPEAGRRFVREFGATQPGEAVDVSAVYAAAAADLLLDAIARSDGTRASVTREVLRARVNGGLTGDFRITPIGDMNRNPITILRAERPGGARTVMAYDGARVDRVIDPPVRLVR